MNVGAQSLRVMCMAQSLQIGCSFGVELGSAEVSVVWVQLLLSYDMEALRWGSREGRLFVR